MMRVSDCVDCGAYKYIEQNGKCRSCASGRQTVTLRNDIFSVTLVQNPDILRAIADTYESDPRIEYTPATAGIDGDLDIVVDEVVLHDASSSYYSAYKFSDYSGTKAERCAAALRDAHDEAAARFD